MDVNKIGFFGKKEQRMVGKWRLSVIKFNLLLHFDTFNV